MPLPNPCHTGVLTLRSGVYLCYSVFIRKHEIKSVLVEKLLLCIWQGISIKTTSVKYPTMRCWAFHHEMLVLSMRVLVLHHEVVVFHHEVLVFYHEVEVLHYGYTCVSRIMTVNCTAAILCTVTQLIFSL